MGCCGENRAAFRAQSSVSHALPPSRPRPPEPEREQGPGVAFEYRGDAPILLRGTASGRLYTFSPARRVRLVAGADTQQLAQSPLFRPASG
jgi:hypothetical protein